MFVRTHTHTHVEKAAFFWGGGEGAEEEKGTEGGVLYKGNKKTPLHLNTPPTTYLPIYLLCTRCQPAAQFWDVAASALSEIAHSATNLQYYSARWVNVSKKRATKNKKKIAFWIRQ